MDDYLVARTRMVNSQLRTENVTDYDVLAAMSEVPRERFVPAGEAAFAYVDRDILLAAAPNGNARYLMEPAPFARLLQAAGINRGDAVLVVGCGTGYSAAVVARLAASVVAVESDAGLAARALAALTGLGVTNAEVVTGPLEAGSPSRGPFDVILIEGAVELVPEALLGQLKEGGRLVAVVGYGRSAAAKVFTRSAGEFGTWAAFDAAVKPLPGFRKPEAFVF